ALLCQKAAVRAQRRAADHAGERREGPIADHRRDLLNDLFGWIDADDIALAIRLLPLGGTAELASEQRARRPHDAGDEDGCAVAAFRPDAAAPNHGAIALKK